MKQDEVVDLLRIGSRVDEVRRREALSGRAFAERLGVASSHMSMVLRGQIRPSWELITALSRRMNISIDWLLTGQIRAPIEEAPRHTEANPMVSVSEVELQDLASAIRRTPALTRLVLEEHYAATRQSPKVMDAVELVQAVYQEGDAAKITTLETVLGSLARPGRTSGAQERSQATIAKTA